MNAGSILRRLYEDDRARTLTQLAQDTGLSRPTVRGALDDLIQRGWVSQHEGTSKDARAGRPARSFLFRDDAGVVAGVDLGPHGVTVEVSDLRGQLLAKTANDDVDLSAAAAASEWTRRTLREALREVGDVPLLATTVGLPAIVNDEEIALTTVVPQWVSAGLLAELRVELPGEAVFFENDANLAGVAEHEWGQSAGAESAVHVLLGRRISSSLVVHGRLVRGAHGGAGEIGALAGSGWQAAHAELVRDGSSVERLFRDARAGDRTARSRVRAFGRALAPGLAALCLAIDPAVVVIGGDAARAGEILVAPLSRELRRLTLFEPPIRTSTFPNAVARGATARAVAHVREVVLAFD